MLHAPCMCLLPQLHVPRRSLTTADLSNLRQSAASTGTYSILCRRLRCCAATRGVLGHHCATVGRRNLTLGGSARVTPPPPSPRRAQIDEPLVSHRVVKPHGERGQQWRINVMSGGWPPSFLGQLRSIITESDRQEHGTDWLHRSRARSPTARAGMQPMRWTVRARK